MRIHFVIGKKDADIAYWVKSLPYGCLNNYIAEILKAEARKKIANIPVPLEEGLLFQKIDITIRIKDKQIINMITNNSGKKNTFIKSAIRKHIALNHKRISRQSSAGDNNDNPVADEKEIKNPVVIETPIQPKAEEEIEKVPDEPKDDFYARMMKLAKH